MKVGLCIKFFHENYGGMLQAYATMKVLSDYGLQCDLIKYGKKSSAVGKIKNLPRLLNGILLNDKMEEAKKRVGLILHPEFKANYNIRMDAFKRFREKTFDPFVVQFEGYRELCAGAKNYDAVITGSDQLWSPAGLPTNFYNLHFVSDNIRKISYASSFGVKKIPWYQIKRTRDYLNRIPFISMRENRGSEIVYELTGRKVPTILDPVFMYDEAGWKKLIQDKKIVDGDYIFAYFLGSNKEHRDAVIELAKATGYKIVCLRHLDQYVKSDEFFGDVGLYDVDPADFLNILRYAQIVCTDSFHGSVFSIIHHKKFVVFNRYSEKSSVSKNSRIDTLCTNFDISGCRYNSKIEIVDQLKESIDYSMVDQKLIQMRKDAENYLISALGLNE